MCGSYSVVGNNQVPGKGLEKEGLQYMKRLTSTAWRLLHSISFDQKAIILQPSCAYNSTLKGLRVSFEKYPGFSEHCHQMWAISRREPKVVRSITDQSYRAARILASIDEPHECVAASHAACRIDELLQARKQVHR